MLVGSLGTFLFRTSSFDVTTFKNLARKRNYNFSEHEVVKGKPYLQFAGEALEEITFDMVLDIGTKYLGNFVIRDISEKDKEILGNLITRMELSVSLKEYH